MPEIRPEQPDDADGIRALNRAAFEGDAEAKLVDLLRERGRNVVSLVAVEDGQVVGQVLFTDVTVTPPAPYKGIGLAPMAVARPRQLRAPPVRSTPAPLPLQPVRPVRLR